VIGQFTLTGQSDLTVSFTQPQGRDHVFGIFQAGINQACTDNPVGCYDPKAATSGSHTFPQLDAGDYYLVTQVFSPEGQGPVTVTLSTPSQMEICDNGIDDNGNGLIDCQEESCKNAPNCKQSICDPDINSGVLVVNGAPHHHSFNTSSADVSENLTCQQSSGGKDVVVHFVLKETAGILLRWSQSGDHVVGIFRSDGPGTPCDADQLECYDPGGRNQDEVAFNDEPPGDYYMIFKATAPGDEGHVDIELSAFRNRRVELCGNGIDDDGNGLIDCADPACMGVAGCGSPFCKPDSQLGNMMVGDQQQVSLDIKNNGSPGYNASCAKGGGLGMVVQFTVPTGGQNGGIGISFDCTQPSGDHVLDLFLAGGPRDPCDLKANELVCGDPTTLPFGCGYIVPNLQPGTYNVLVAAFKPGDEGQVNLRLGITDDRQLEICNNGIDDDHDGFTD
jgi:hypothetical protein